MSSDQPSDAELLIQKVISLVWRQDGYSVQEMLGSTRFDMIRREVLVASLEKMREDTK